MDSSPISTEPKSLVQVSAATFPSTWIPEVIEIAKHSSSRISSAGGATALGNPPNNHFGRSCQWTEVHFGADYTFRGGPASRKGPAESSSDRSSVTSVSLAWSISFNPKFSSHGWDSTIPLLAPGSSTSSWSKHEDSENAL